MKGGMAGWRDMTTGIPTNHIVGRLFTFCESGMSKMGQTKTARQSRLLQRLADAKDSFLNSIADLDPATLCTEHVIGDWTVKDILGHIVSWDREFRADIKLILNGKHPGYERHISGDDDFNQWNQHWIALKRNWAWQHIRADFDQDYQEAVQLIMCLEPQDFRKRGVTPWKRAAVEKPAMPAAADTDSVETLITFHWRHINQHTRMIEKWRRRRAR